MKFHFHLADMHKQQRKRGMSLMFSKASQIYSSCKNIRIPTVPEMFASSYLMHPLKGVP